MDRGAVDELEWGLGEQEWSLGNLPCAKRAWFFLASVLQGFRRVLLVLLPLFFFFCFFCRENGGVPDDKMGGFPFLFFLQVDGTYDGKGDMRWEMASCKWERGGGLCMVEGVASGESWEMGIDGRCLACRWERGRVASWCKTESVFPNT